MRLLLAVLASVATYLIGIRHGRSTYYSPPEYGVQQLSEATHTRPKGAEKDPVRAAIESTVGQHSTGDQEHQRAERRYWRRSLILGGASSGAAVVAAIFAADAYQASLRAVKEAHQQVIAAQNANEISGRVLAATIGAAVDIGKAEFRLLPLGNKEPRINVVMPITNDGGSTTRLSYSSACPNFFITPSDPFSVKRLAVAPSYHVTLATKETARPILCAFTIRDWARITAEHGSIYVYGYASYPDTIDPGTIHRLEFCTRIYDLGFSANLLLLGPNAMSVECEKHNCHDKECTPPKPPVASNSDPNAF